MIGPKWNTGEKHTWKYSLPKNMQNNYLWYRRKKHTWKYWLPENMHNSWLCYRRRKTHENTGYLKICTTANWGTEGYCLNSFVVSQLPKSDSGARLFWQLDIMEAKLQHSAFLDENISLLRQRQHNLLPLVGFSTRGEKSWSSLTESNCVKRSTVKLCNTIGASRLY